MKRNVLWVAILIALCCLLCGAASAEVAIDETHFPDANFREFVKTFDKDGNGILSDAEIADATFMDCAGMEIASLEGIGYFTAVEHLDVQSNQLTELDLSQCTALTDFLCTGNRLTSLNLSGCAGLSWLCMDRNPLTKLDLSGNPELMFLTCKNCQMETLDVSACSRLLSLNCPGNQLKQLDVSRNTALQVLSCADNGLSSLDLSKNADLAELWCGGNHLASLDLSGNPFMEFLDCSRNRLTGLDLSHTPLLVMLSCWGNQFTALDVTPCPELCKYLLGPRWRHDAPTPDSAGDVYDQWTGGFGSRDLRVDTDVTVTGGVVVSRPLSDGIYEFVTRCYQLILNREPDIDGLAAWTHYLQWGDAMARDIVLGFMNSEEYAARRLSNEKTVEILYRAMLDRAPDAAGRAYWVSRLDGGARISEIVDGFCGAPEFIALCRVYGIEPGSAVPELPAGTEMIQAFVKRCYRLMLDRVPDSAGFADWVIRLDDKSKTAAEIIYGFVYSEEYTNRHLTDGQTVEILYNTMLNRISDAAGKADWLNRLANGARIVDIINGFCGSPEFRKLCASYDIEPGRVAVAAARVVKQSAASARTAANVSSAEKPARSPELAAFIRRCYQAALGREADEAELSGWSAAGVSPKQAAKAVLFSDEAQARLAGDEDFVRALYRLYFGREADPEGLALWTEKLKAGESREALADAFAGSDEFRAVLSGMKQ